MTELSHRLEELYETAAEKGEADLSRQLAGLSVSILEASEEIAGSKFGGRWVLRVFVTNG